MQNFDWGSFNLKDIFNVDVKKQYMVKISNRFVAFENFDDNVEISRAWESNGVDIKISTKENLAIVF
jgi:hypothetical protein